MTKQPKRKATPRASTPKEQGVKVSKEKVRASKPQKNQKRKTQKQKKPLIKRVAFWLKTACICCIVLLATGIVLSFTPVFKIETIEVEPSLHVSQEDAISLTQIPDGANLLNVNPFAISGNLQKNPWVGSVDIERIFPHTLKLIIHEKTTEALVPMVNTQTVWALSPEKVWIQPVDVASQDAASLVDAALKLAVEQGSFVVTNIADDLNPKAGEVCNDEKIDIAYQIEATLSSDLSSQIVQYDIPNSDAITLTLKSGIEIAIGSTSQLDTKEAVIKQLLSSYENQITYINVRNPAKPAYKKANADGLQPGSGIEGLQK